MNDTSDNETDEEDKKPKPDNDTEMICINEKNK